MSKQTNKDVKRQMGIPLQGYDSKSMGEDSAVNIMKAAAESAPYKQDRTKGAPKKKRGGQPGNKNAGGGASFKQGLYANFVGVEHMERRFKNYSKALGKASALEEVALTRAMIANILQGMDPLGCGKIEEPELLNAYARDMLMLNLKAQERLEKQEKERREQEAKAGAKAGINIQFTAEAMNAMNGIAEAQDVGVSPEELMTQARERIEEREAARAAAEADGQEA